MVTGVQAFLALFAIEDIDRHAVVPARRAGIKQHQMIMCRLHLFPSLEIESIWCAKRYPAKFVATSGGDLQVPEIR